MGERLTVAGLNTAAVKGLRLQRRAGVLLERTGARGDRSFYLVDGRGWLQSGKQLGALHEVTAELDEGGERLTLAFPGARVLSGAVRRGTRLQTRFHSRPRAAHELLGPFSAALSEHAGRELRLVAPADGSAAVDRGAEGAVTLISHASLHALARVAARREVDSRRFRMTIEVSGSGAHEEDRWLGRELRIGAARVLLHGHVGRCVVTCRDPESGAIDMPTLDLLRSYRESAETTEPLAFGVYGSVLQAGEVRLGDPVTLAPAAGVPAG